MAVIGAGFAGLAAARTLQRLGFTVTLFEARGTTGGRVESTSTFIPGRILERGAELIGRNHFEWVNLARHYGLGLSVLTTEDDYQGAGLAQPIRVGNQELDDRQARRLYEAMQMALNDLTRDAAVITQDILLRPWEATGASDLDRESIQSWIGSWSHYPHLREALEFEFSNDMAVATEHQSKLAILAQIAAGGYELYWDQTEVYRCEDGNAALADHLVSSMRDSRPRVTLKLNEPVLCIDRAPTGLSLVSGQGGVTLPHGEVRYTHEISTHCQYAVIAVPPSVWPAIKVNNVGLHTQVSPVQMGKAVKYLAHVDRRFWITNGLAPNAVDTLFGGIWEGTDNQMGARNVDLTVFAGGPRTAVGGNPEAYFKSHIDQIFRGFNDNFVKSSFADWPNEPHILTGYACPAPNEVTGAVRRLNTTSLLDRIFFAGEHVSPGFFGYMEGALQSGLHAAFRIAAAEGIHIPLGR